MAEKKNQHFVPKLHLKQFSSNDLINSYDLVKKEFRKGIPYASQCQKAYLYGSNLVIENALGPLESHSANIINTITANEVIPEKNSPEYNALLTYVLFQICRTIYARETQQKLLTNFFNTFIKPQMIAKGISENDLYNADMSFTAPFNNLLKQAATAIPLLYDLDCSIYINQSDLEYISSDNPCFMINSYASNSPGSIGWAKIGLEIIFPISPEILIVWADPNVYDITNKITLTSGDDVKSINACIASHCKQNIYFRSVSDTDILNIIADVIESGPAEIYSKELLDAFSPNKRLFHMLRGAPKLPKDFKIFPVKANINVDREDRDPYLVYLNRKFVKKVEEGIYKGSQWLDFLDSEIDE